MNLISEYVLFIHRVDEEMKIFSKLFILKYCLYYVSLYKKGMTRRMMLMSPVAILKGQYAIDSPLPKKQTYLTYTIFKIQISQNHSNITLTIFQNKNKLKCKFCRLLLENYTGI